uniref:Uncharacterized protein n=1 Tax=Panagrellus redivivus TaxID=6233 RepID=A0A7E4UV20_PANRE
MLIFPNELPLQMSAGVRNEVVGTVALDDIAVQPRSKGLLLMRCNLFMVKLCIFVNRQDRYLSASCFAVIL